MWRERGLTMVLVTHDSTVARRAPRIGVMKQGRLTIKAGARTHPAAASLTREPPPPVPSAPGDSISFDD